MYMYDSPMQDEHGYITESSPSDKPFTNWSMLIPYLLVNVVKEKWYKIGAAYP